MKAFTSIGLLVACCVFSVFPITITVSKTGGGDCITIKDAINKAMPGDVITITDSAVYNEQVTIDSTKYPLTLKSKNPTSLNKPKILWLDKANVGPRTYGESQIDSMITYLKNGALRLINARNVIIDGMAIDGGGVFPFGYPSVWEQRYGLQSGNAAIMLHRCGDIILRNCDIANAYFGLYIYDHNPGGIVAPLDPVGSFVPLSGFGLTGNHLIERNRIHDNSWGMFFESSWDLGSTVRYNLIFENHHPNDSIATTVHNLTSDEGANQPGGAFLFKDDELSPLAIYNNTLYHNFGIFSGHWQAGYQHLVFNNIFGPPYKYWSNTTPSFNTDPMELTRAMPNRIYNCIYSAQQQAPQPSYVMIMNQMQLQGTGGVAPDPGTLIAGTNAVFPTTANNRWLEITDAMFLSTNPASENFLEPNWVDENVKQFIVQQGWQKSGVKNTDGTWADLGAIEQAHGTPSFIGTIKPQPLPIIVNGTSVNITFTLDEREGTTMTNPTIKLFRLVRIKYVKGTFGNGEKTMVIATTDLTDLAIPTTPPVEAGPNSYSISANITGDFPFIEMIIEATGADGKRFTTAAGFLPYRKLNYVLSVKILDTAMSRTLTEVKVGEPAVLRIIPQVDSEVFTIPIKPLQVTLISGFDLMDASKNPLIPLEYPNGIPGGIDNKIVMFSKIPDGNIEYVTAAGVYKNPSTGTVLPFIGGTSVKILPGPPEKAMFNDPPSNSRGLMPPTLPAGYAYPCTLFVFDKYGNLTNDSCGVKISNNCLSCPAKVIYNGKDSVFKPDSNGVVSFLLQTTDNAKEGDIVQFMAQVVGSSKVDTANMIVGPHVSGVLRNPDAKSRLKAISNLEAVVSLFDLQGRRVFRRTFSSWSGISSPAYFLRGYQQGLSSKAYLMEMIIKDKTSMKQTRSVQKIMVR